MRLGWETAMTDVDPASLQKRLEVLTNAVDNSISRDDTPMSQRVALYIGLSEHLVRCLVRISADMAREANLTLKGF